MTPAMIDCQVLSFAIVSEPPADKKHGRQQRDSKALIGGFAEVRTSAIVVLELLRGPPSVVSKVRSSGILDLLQVEPVDAAVSMLAASILEQARGSKNHCTRCFNTVGATKCRKCGQLVSHQQKTHDALIVATASLLADVDTLYSYDPGVHELGKFANRIEVKVPPDLDGPLFAGTV